MLSEQITHISRTRVQSNSTRTYRRSGFRDGLERGESRTARSISSLVIPIIASLSKIANTREDHRRSASLTMTTSKREREKQRRNHLSWLVRSNRDCRRTSLIPRDSLMNIARTGRHQEGEITRKSGKGRTTRGKKRRDPRKKKN